MPHAEYLRERSFQDIRVHSSEIRVRRIGAGDLWESLKQGYDDFAARPSFGVFLVIIYPLFACLFTLFLLGENLLHLAFPLVAGFTLLGPVVSVALFEMSRRRERGLDLTWRSTFEFVHSHAFAPIVGLSLIMMLLYVGWLFMAQFIYTGLFGQHAPASFSDFAHQLVTTRHGAGLMLHGTVVGAIFAFTALATSVVGFPLLLDRPATSMTAVSVSVRAVASNIWVMLLWGLIVVFLLAAGATLFLIGLAAVLPILGHSTWHLYRKLVEP